MSNSGEILGQSINELLKHERETKYLDRINRGLRTAFNGTYSGGSANGQTADPFELELKGRPDILIPRLYPPIITRCGFIFDKGPRFKGKVAVEGLLIPDEHRSVGNLFVVLNTDPTSDSPERYGVKAKMGMVAGAAEHLGVEIYPAAEGR